MKSFQIIIIIIFTLISNNLLAFNAKPSIAVFVLSEFQNVNSVNISVTSSLNKQGFMAKDGNLHLNKISNITKLNVGDAQYNAICNNEGGMKDDIIVYCCKEKYILIVNASNSEKIYNWMK